MNTGTLPEALEKFTSQVSALLKHETEEARFLPKIGKAMEALLAEDSWLDDSLAQPHPENYQQYLLYADPDDRFSVVSFVWAPGQQTPIHDHTVWGVIGLLRGAECSQNYEIAQHGIPQAVGQEITMTPGSVEFVSPGIGDIHKVRNASDRQVSISIHAYGANIGKVKRHVFPPEGGAPKDFISGYSNAGTG